MTEDSVLWPAEAARLLGVPTGVVVRLMYERRVERVRLEDGTLGIPTSALDRLRLEST